MANHKKEPLKNLGDPNKLMVQKSLPLFSLWRSDLTLAEFKILDTYLARINSHDTERRAVVFEKGELEEILGVKRIPMTELDKRLARLMTTVKVEATSNKFKRIALFEIASAEQDQYGIWQVNLECTKAAMNYIFNIENLGYFRYKLRCITSLTSRYAYIMFIYLESNRFRKTWKVSLEELKKILNCEKEETYKEFKFFNVKILKKVQKELLEKTECKYSFETVKRGRTVVGIKFTLETLADKDKPIEQEQHKKGMLRFGPNEGYIGKEVLWEFALDNLNVDFTEKQKKELLLLLEMMPDRKLPQVQTSSEAGNMPGDIHDRRLSYMLTKVAEINRIDEEKPIKNKFAYLKKVLEQDMTDVKTDIKQTQPTKQNKFNNFPQRSYDYAELEKQLLGNNKKEE